MSLVVYVPEAEFFSLGNPQPVVNPIYIGVDKYAFGLANKAQTPAGSAYGPLPLKINAQHFGIVA